MIKSFFTTSHNVYYVSNKDVVFNVKRQLVELQLNFESFAIITGNFESYFKLPIFNYN